MRRSAFLCLALLVGIARGQKPSATLAPDPKKDPVLLLLRSAHEKYTKRDTTGATADVAEALKLLEAQKAATAGILLPELEGWTATAVEKSDLGGLGKVTKRSYVNVKDGRQVEAELTIDSPAVEKLSPLLSNDLVAQGAGFKKARVDGMNGLTKENDKGTELNLWFGGASLFKLTSKGANAVKASDLETLARKFDLKGMAALQPKTSDKR
jgi:hypothetical protein